MIEFNDKKINNKTPEEIGLDSSTSQIVTCDCIEISEASLNNDNERAGWENKFDFLFSCISVSVGLGNIWRFPYLCYKNGGGAFIITYSIAMIFCGIPIFFQEVAIGQYLGTSGINLIGQLCPILQGVGYATMTIVFFLNIYYCIIIAWTIFYLIKNYWNTDNCYTLNISLLNTNNNGNHTSSVEEYWERRVLNVTNGIDNIGKIQWELLTCLTIGWIIIYLIIRRGIHQSGKIIWFTALFPNFVLIILLIRAVTLKGAIIGIKYYITPKWEVLLTSEPWIDGATQIFFAYSIGTGALPALGSFNKFHHNSFKDAMITCIVNTLTCLVAGCVTFSILGHIAHEQNTDVSSVVKSGPGLVFSTYPQVISKIPGSPIWAGIFFFMLIMLGIDSEFCTVEAFITGIIDNWPNILRQQRNKFTLIICCLMFILGIPMVTQGGVYIFQLMDTYSASGISILWVCFFQTIAISWIFGTKQFTNCIYKMMGIELSKFWSFCWLIFAPVIMICIFIFQCIELKPLKYGDFYEYPIWSQVIGYLISLSSMIWIPGYVIYYVTTEPQSIKKNFLKGLKANISKSRGKDSSKNKIIIPISESNDELITHNHSFSSQHK
ncbi:hypothetical protein HCN44_003104 [Aphidius gifuensis]|uniref:Transporter n=1 Tax=Aphidius gifuensis TaxID=684658 RepID=A0A834XIB7_APHGI|nr:hypothetical protein HCN44_003104 [Aphidius gifuensis]